MDPTVNPSQYPPAQPQYQQPQQQPPFPQQPYQPPFPPQSYQPHQAAPTATADSAGWRRWLSGALGIAGGSIVLSVVEGQLPYSLSGVSGGSAAIVVLLMAQLLFGVAVVVVAYLGAPGPVASRAIGIGLFVVAVIAVTALQTMRMTGGSGGPVLGTILYNPLAWLVLVGALGWLLAMRPRPIVYVSLVAVIVLFLPIEYGLVMANLEFAITDLVMRVIALVIAVVILVAGAIRGRQR